MTPESALGALISIGIGVALIFLGKNLRMFAAAVGFLLGVQFVALFSNSLLLGLIVGGVLAIGGVILLRLGKTFIGLIVQLIGAAAGAGILLWFLSSIGLNLGVLGNIIVAGVGAVAGFFLMARFYDLGLLILVSLVGASLIVSGVNYFITLGDGVTTVATIAITVVGIILLQRKPAGKK
jgi:hypothetical protein